jgi:four helix bundle protein
MNQLKFSFENLEVWQRAIEISRYILNLTESIKNRRKHYRLIEQLESAATSISLNIAEGKGRYSKKEFIRFLYIARGSLYETVSLLIIFAKNNWIKNEDFIKISA